MPCKDLTEILTLTIDTKDRLIDYTLNKKSCSKPIGDQSLLLSLLKNKTTENILNLSGKDLIPPDEKDFNEIFLFEKHFNAIKHGIKAFLGDKSKSLHQYFRTSVKKIVHSEGSINIEVEISLNISGGKSTSAQNLSQIKPCCKTCTFRG
ncbi:hypothetical protein KKG71_05695 [Patescibacteria group bacterium]|nr:hypothetical protein [Patescibacteria group bacterium]